MDLSLKEEEYRRLMVLAYLGEWMVNAIQKNPDSAFVDLVDKIYAQTKDTPLEKLVEFNPDDLGWVPSEAFDAEAHALIDQYDDKTFWEELTARLTERDLVEKYGDRAVKGMRPDARSRAASAIAKAYTTEFEEYGIDRLGFAE